MVRIKICGITRTDDAMAAAEAGADAIGLIFVPGSPRYLEMDAARRILACLPPFVTPVGVFMDAPLAEVRQRAADLGLRTVQLHGHEPVEAISQLAPLAVIKGLAVRDESIYEQIRQWTRAGAAAILLDKPRSATRSDPAPMPWPLLAPEALQHHCGTTAPLLLAGGLDAECVTRAVRIVRPYGVDVSSGVERTAGVKDHNLIQRFVLGVRAAMPPGAER